MPPKKTTPASAASPSTAAAAAAPSSSGRASAQPTSLASSVSQVWTNYTKHTPQRTKLIDVFMAFLILVGGLQFLYCLIVGNYPFNAFLAGFSATVGQFVLTASLRIQTTPANRAEFSEKFSDERAFADFVFGSLILHFFCVNFIN